MDAGFLRLLGRVIRGRRQYDSASLFRNSTIHDALRRDGFCITDHFLTEECIAELDAIVTGHPPLEALDEPGYTYAVRWGDPPELSLETKSRMESLLVPEIEAMTTPGAARIILSAVQIKPSAPESALLGHQDFFVVDETEHYSLNAWVSMQHSDENSGALFVLPGSHQYGNWKRIASLNDDLAGLHDVIARHARVLESEPGQVVLLDHALIHGSTCNASGRRRAAISCHVVPRHAGLMVARVSDTTPAGVVEFERIDASLLDAVVRPADPGIRRESAPIDELRIGPRGLDALCRVNAAIRH